MMKGIGLLVVCGSVLMLANSSAAAASSGQCLDIATQRADRVLQVLNENNAPTRNILRTRGDPCLRRVGTWTLARRVVVTANNEFFREFIFPSGTRHYIRVTHAVYAHDTYEGAVLCPNGAAAAFDGMDQILPPGPLGSNPNAYFDAIDNVDLISTFHFVCDSRP